jgi:hypothetical protein
VGCWPGSEQSYGSDGKNGKIDSNSLNWQTIRLLRLRHAAGSVPVAMFDGDRVGT